MLFPTVAFAVFMVVAFIVNWMLRPTYRPWLWGMTALSLVFYGWTDARFVLLLMTSALVNWAFGDAIARSLVGGGEPTVTSRNLVRAAVVVNLVFLGFFKYFGFFVDSFAASTRALGLGFQPPVLEIALPVGISFFTFHAISYVIDVGRGQLAPMRADEVALYLSFFPHLVAGPIVRAGELLPQLRHRPDPRRIPSTEAFGLITVGLFKKVVVSTYLASNLVDPVFGAPGAHSSLELLAAVYAYAIVIYADFSGYTDIAIGCALLLGIRFPQNFDKPYRALSLQEFWRRWHITLSRWLRDYLYVPLGGSREGVRRTYRNLFLTMVLGGLWHGASMTFVVWGALHGSFLVGERVARERWRAWYPEPVLPAAAATVLRWVVTFHLVCLAWIFFRADSVGTAFDVLAGLVGSPGPAPLVTGLAVVTIVAALAAQIVPRPLLAEARARFASLDLLPQAVVLATALTVIDVLGPEGVAPFIYFRF